MRPVLFLDGVLDFQAFLAESVQTAEGLGSFVDLRTDLADEELVRDLIQECGRRHSTNMLFTPTEFMFMKLVSWCLLLQNKLLNSQ